MLEIDKKTLRRIFLGVCGVIVLYWLLHETDRVKGVLGMISDVLSPFIFGGVVAFILNVPMRAIENTLLKKIEKLKLRRVLALILTYVLLLLVISLAFWLLIPQLIATINLMIPSLTAFFTEAETAVNRFLSENPKLFDWLIANTNFEGISWAAMAERALAMLGNSMSVILGGAVSAIGSIFSGVFNAVIALVFSVYCLFQKEILARQGRKLLYAFCKEKNADHIIRVLRLTNSNFSNFLSGQCVEVCILAAMFAICMAIFRMPYIPLISVIIAITAFIPIIGAWTGCALGAFLIFVEDPILALWFVVMSIVIQQVENNLIYPRVVGNSVGLSGMWVLIAVAVGGELMGILGMFLMIPLLSVFYTLIREHTNRKLSEITIEPEKLKAQPPELISRHKGNDVPEGKKKFPKRKKKTEKKTEDPQ